MNKLPTFSELRRDASLSAITAGLIAVLVGFAGPFGIAFQVADAAGLSPAQVTSWIWTACIGAGVTCIGLSCYYRVPIVTAWSTPGAALLITAMVGLPFAEAIGAFIISAVLLAATGLTGIFEKLMRYVPKALAGAMFAGILFRFGIDVFIAVPKSPVLALSLFVGFLLYKRIAPRYVIPLLLSSGIVLAAALGEFKLFAIEPRLAVPIFTAPEFSLRAFLGVALPLTLVTLTGQHVPGIAVLRAAGYTTPASPLVSWTSLTSLVLAPFGSHGLNLAAITAAICTNKESHEDPARRYIAGISCGIFNLMLGTFAGTIVALFVGLPKALIASVAGLALLGAIVNGLTTAMADARDRECALITFLVTASGVSFLGIGAAFWGLVAGALAMAIMLAKAPESPVKTLNKPSA